MVLAADLLQEFAKLTNDTNRNVADNSVMHGTIVEYNNSKWVQIDGSDQLTPISYVTNVYDGDRVIVGIQNHKAIVNGNLSRPSTTNKNVEDISAIVVGQVVADEVDAKFADLDVILSKYVKTETLEAEYITSEVIESTYIKAEDLTADFAKIEYLEANYLTAERIEAEYAKIENLDATYAKIKDLDAKYAKVVDLNAANAVIGNLNSKVANISTLMFGSATGDVIHANFANAVIQQIGDAQIKSAMIESVAADKIVSGDIITNNIRVMSEDGRLIISDETIQISDDNRVRVQIGKDSSNDYSINIWDADGKLMFSEGGITDSAIKEAIIRNDMIADNANISASKLDIDSLFTEINGSIKTINSTKIYLDDKNQTLDIAFKSMSSSIDSLSNDLSSQGTAISVIQGQIENKIWLQDFSGDGSGSGADLTDLIVKYTELTQTVDSISSTVAEHSVEIGNLEIGGRNLLLGTATGKGWAHYSSFDAETREFTKSNSAANENMFYCNNKFDLEAGQMYTLSFKAKQNGYLRSQENDVYILPGTWGSTGIAYNRRITDLTTEYKEYVFTFIPNDKATSLTDCQLRFDNEGTSTVGTEAILYIKDVKLEKGNKATDWSPAPEDLATSDDVKSLSTRVEQTTESISIVAEKTTANEDAIANLELTADGLRMKLSSMTIGGRNLLAGTSSDYVRSGNKGTGSFKDVWMGETIDIPTRTEYVVSFDAKADVEQTINCYFYNPNTTVKSESSTGHTSTLPDGFSEVKITTEWKRYWVKWTQTPANAIKHLVIGRNYTENNVYIRAVKLETGNKATDWSPAPEDILRGDSDASKTATNYLNFSNGGLVIGDMTAATLGKNVLIDSDSVDIRMGSNVLASFADKTIKLGIASTDATIDLCGDAGQIKASSYNNNSVFDSLDISAPYLSLTGDTIVALKSARSTIDGEIGVFQDNSVSGDHIGNYTRSHISSYTRNSTHKSYAMVGTVSYEDHTDATANIIAADEIRDKFSAIRAYPDYIEMETDRLDLLADSVNISGNLTVSGFTTFAQTATANGAFVANGTSTFNNGIEISHATPYIDFHFGKSTVDYTSRIIENEKGVLTITGGLKVANVATLASLNVNSGTHLYGHTYLEQIGIYGAIGSGTYRELMRLGGTSSAPILYIGDGLYTNKVGETHIGGGTNVTLSAQNNQLMFYDTPDSGYTGIFRPTTKGKCTLGAAAYTWHAVYAANATIQTSDRREKENILPLGSSPIMTFSFGDRQNAFDMHSELFDRLQPVQYNFIDGNGRTCYGLIAQDVIDAMNELGFEENDLDLVHHESYIDEETGEEKETYGLAYTNLIALLIHEVQKLKAVISEIST